MDPERILVPIDLDRHSLDVFKVVNSRVQKGQVVVILLHVLKLNIVLPDNRVYEELTQEAQAQLKQLADRHLDPMASCVSRICSGRPADQIAALANAEHVDWIVLPDYGAPFWVRLKALWKPETEPPVFGLAKQLLERVSCGVIVVPARNCSNCANAGSREAGQHPSEKGSNRGRAKALLTPFIQAVRPRAQGSFGNLLECSRFVSRQ
jgi:nucleotide-binding universal stress UspA family protein